MEKKFLVAIDAEACIACGLCAEIAPKIFEPSEQMISQVLENAEIDPEILLKAARSCPTKAITVTDADTGNQLWPE
ncbi:MAG: ferredoxin [Patescibacteria group bacterium]|nr:ferredoxin [Patescibacteria group bacterium]